MRLHRMSWIVRAKPEGGTREISHGIDLQVTTGFVREYFIDEARKAVDDHEQSKSIGPA
jgi:hypothetical protein